MALSIIIFSEFGCIDPIDIEIDGELDRPVIDGYITNIEKTHELILSKSSKFSNQANPSISGAMITVVDNQGSEEVFVEVEFGVYNSRSNFKGIPGRSYSLKVVLKNGESYESTPQIMPPPTSIRDVYFEEGYETIIRRVDDRTSKVEGINIVTPVVNKSQTTQYFKYEIVPTWIYEAPRARVESNQKYCYVTDENNTFSIIKDKVGGFDHTIAFIPHSTKFEFGISFKVQQFSMSVEAYTFWENIKTQSEYNGSIFDVPPFSIRGNMKPTNENSEEMLGFFGVYSEDSNRIYLDNSLLSYSLLYDRAECFPPNRRFRSFCFFCTAYPGEVTNVKPNYWPE